MMKGTMKFVGLLITVMIITSSFKNSTVITMEDKIQWMSFEEAVLKMEKEPKKLFIDVYTDWCGWCKKMDGSTFIESSVVKEMNANFYAVKFNAEQKEDIDFNGHTFKFVAQGKRGYHELAGALLNGKLSYPSFVLMNERMEIIQPLPGYKTSDELLPILKYIGENHFQNTDWETYLQTYEAK